MRTLRNAFTSGRIHHAYMLTGVRGVGKTTTARILARALNYQLDGQPDTGPSLDMPQLGVHCPAILESRHVDVLEMDAASNTSINDIREIIEAVKYKPLSARTKVYIIDEVHMLSTAAFNGLLKTLEEPPPHVKFIFATTEIRKVPVTILSRCMRFDLRRIEPAVLMAHLSGICVQEQVSIEQDALRLIARAAEGSVRDALSLLDQAIAYGHSKVLAADVQHMLGISDGGRLYSVFDALAKADAQGALAAFDVLYQDGADPAVVVGNLLEFTHQISTAKVSGLEGLDDTVHPAEREAIARFAPQLSHAALQRMWALMLKGLNEVEAASAPHASAQMLLIRLCYAASLPAPDELLKMHQHQPMSDAVVHAPAGRPSGGGAAAHAVQMAPVAAVAAQPNTLQNAMPNTIEALLELAEARKKIALKTMLERDVHVVAYAAGRIEIQPAAHASKTLVADLQRGLLELTQSRWWVSISQPASQAAAPATTIFQKRHHQEQEQLASAAQHPFVKLALEQFVGAKLRSVRAMDTAIETEGETDV